jgi:signal peptidase complex subunit 1
VLSFLVGFFTQDIVKALYLGLGGTALTFFVVVPQWPWYNQNAERWLPARMQRASNNYVQGVNLGGVQIEVDGRKVG